jgi:hypothetical protein
MIRIRRAKADHRLRNAAPPRAKHTSHKAPSVAVTGPVAVADVRQDTPIFGSSRYIHNDVINALIRTHGYHRYLEIGCDLDACFNAITCDEKVGVDPVRGGNRRMTSDDYFATKPDKFDIIFIDGDHRHPQVYRDIGNSLECLAEGGTIVMHDCMPPALVYEGPGFCGTVWRAFAKFRERLDLDGIVGEFDFGVGMIRVRPNPSPIRLPKSMDELVYTDLIANRQAWMRPVSDLELMAIARGEQGSDASRPSVAVLVLGKSDEEIADFKARSPDALNEARFVFVANPGKKLGGYATIANAFLDECTEDVVGVVHADTGFGVGAIRGLVHASLQHGGQLVGIVGRANPAPGETDPWKSYVWGSNGGGPVSTLDSCSVFFPRALALRFDGATFDDFHCVVEDLCLQARVRGIGSFVPPVQAGHIGGSGSDVWASAFNNYRDMLFRKWPKHTIYTV